MKTPISIHFLITTYNRGPMLQRLINSIDAQKDGYRITATVLQDGGGVNYVQYIQFSQPIHTIYNGVNRGKKAYWQTVNELFQAVKNRQRSDIYIMLPDDAVVRENALEDIVKQWKQIQGIAMCLNLRLDRSRIGKSNWGSGLPTIERHGENNYFKTGWVDMAFICGVEFFEALKWKVNSIPLRRWHGSPQLGSGVGHQITTRISKKGKGIYQVRYPVLINGGDGASQMNPHHNEPKEEYHLDPIIAGMATMPGREKYLEKAVRSILPQVDRLYIKFNERENLNPLFTHPKIFWYAPNDDMGDAGKYWGKTYFENISHKLGDCDSFYYLTFDDDLYYPPDHVWRLFHQIERLDRKWIVGTHGRRIPSHKVGSYYGIGAHYHWRKAVTKEAIRVNCIGTGTCGFHSSTIKLSMDDFPLTHKNMADIHLAVATQKQGIPMAVVRHPKDYFKPLGVPPEQTIYHQHKNNDKLQTDLVNSIKWRLI